MNHVSKLYVSSVTTDTSTTQHIVLISISNWFNRFCGNSRSSCGFDLVSIIIIIITLVHKDVLHGLVGVLEFFVFDVPFPINVVKKIVPIRKNGRFYSTTTTTIGTSSTAFCSNAIKHGTLFLLVFFSSSSSSVFFFAGSTSSVAQCHTRLLLLLPFSGSGGFLISIIIALISSRIISIFISIRSLFSCHYCGCVFDRRCSSSSNSSSSSSCHCHQ
mmetsp:Transcript_19028/g.20970  ORF Transcript_19028/g.20970 Transcript_19028/m.20970 type:complete len:216 (-) Transcript_19028:408-1055(-)